MFSIYSRFLLVWIKARPRTVILRLHHNLNKDEIREKQQTVSNQSYMQIPNWYPHHKQGIIVKVIGGFPKVAFHDIVDEQLH